MYIYIYIFSCSTTTALPVRLCFCRTPHLRNTHYPQPQRHASDTQNTKATEPHTTKARSSCRGVSMQEGALKGRRRRGFGR